MALAFLQTIRAATSPEGFMIEITPAAADAIRGVLKQLEGPSAVRIYVDGMG
jgi:Fe-S cluster assembly iron-binding protein IscA